MLEISPIKNGIVIDHIQEGHGYQIFKFLKLYKSDFKAALILNVDSKKFSKKDLIKIENEIDVDLGILGLFSDTITVNYIKDEEVIRKENVVLPEKVEEILRCKNPRCISNHERNMTSRFRLFDREKQEYICQYCDHFFDIKDIKK